MCSLSFLKCTVPPDQRDPILDHYMTEILRRIISQNPGKLLPGAERFNPRFSHWEPKQRQAYLRNSVRELTHNEPFNSAYPGVGSTEFELLQEQEKHDPSDLSTYDKAALKRHRETEKKIMAPKVINSSVPRKKKTRGKRGNGGGGAGSGGGNRQNPRVGSAPRAYPALSTSISNSSMAVSAPTSRTNINRSGIPSIRYRPNGDVRVAHREFILDLPGSVAFAITTINLNPGLPAVFNWLYRIAQSFESYIVHNLQICFETESSTGSTGTVVMAIDYDAADAPPSTKAQALAYRGTVRAAPWTAACHTSLLEDLRKRSSYFIRGGSLVTGQDVTLYDVGNLHLITQGMANTATVGEIWIKYDIEFRTPKTLSAGGGNAVWGKWDADTNASFTRADGNLPASTVFAGGLTYTATWTFVQPWQGTLAVQVSGTGLLMSSLNFTGTAVVGVTGSGAANAAQTFAAGSVQLNAVAGSTLILQLPNASILTGTMIFCQGLGAFN